MDDSPEPTRAVRDLADDHVRRAAELDPLLASSLGLSQGIDELPDLSPDGRARTDALLRDTLDRLALLTGPDGPAALPDPDERRCARLLDERLRAELARSAAGEHLRDIAELFTPVTDIRHTFLMMPLDGPDDWRAVATRMNRVPRALAGWRAALAEGGRRGLHAAPRQIERFVRNLDAWTADAHGRGWFAGFTDGAAVPEPLRRDLDRAAAAAIGAVAELQDRLRSDHLPAADGTPDGVGEERYRLASRYWNGADLDVREVYAWGWSEFRRLHAEMVAEADRVLPGADPLDAMAHLDVTGDVVEGAEAARARLQALMDETIAELGTTHFDLAGPIRRVESCLAPAGSAASPYYTPPSLDLSRPGRTWLPHTPDDRYPMWDLVTTWYHEGVPGHHLQLAQWALRSGELSSFQTSELGGVSANLEGWALYAERLMDELGHHTDPGTRLGYLNAQMLRAVRVVIDIGMHLTLRIPDDSPVAPGGHWTPERGREFFARHVGGGGDALVESELLRYLGSPGQAIGYKLGERAWLQGRDDARRAHQARGAAFDLRTWHMTALSQGSLGLDDLAAELAVIET